MRFDLPGDLLSKQGLLHSLAFLAFTCQTVAFDGMHLGVRCLSIFPPLASVSATADVPFCSSLGS